MAGRSGRRRAWTWTCARRGSAAEAWVTDLPRFRRGDDVGGAGSVIDSGHWAHWMRYNVSETVSVIDVSQRRDRNIIKIAFVTIYIFFFYKW